jgi:flagellar motor protein MotB
MAMKKTKLRKALLVHGFLSVFLFSTFVTPQIILAESRDNAEKAEKEAAKKAVKEKKEADRLATEKAKKEEKQRKKKSKEKEKAEKEATKKVAKEKEGADRLATEKAKKEEEQKKKESKEKEKAEKEATKKAAKEKEEADKYEISYFYVYKNAGSSLGHYIPSGYMGDAKDILLKQTRDVKETYENIGTSLEIIYTPRGSEGWAGLYWLEPANNWGNIQGGFNLKGATKLTFWAKGLTGTEILSEVKIGGIAGKYPDSDTISVKNIGLSKEWQMFEVDLRGRKLSHIIGGFCVIFDKHNNSDGATIFIDDIVYEIRTEK